jgi:hypothetical protein
MKGRTQRTTRQCRKNHTPNPLVDTPKHRPCSFAIDAIGVQFLVIRALHASLNRVERVDEQIDGESRESACDPYVGVAVA